MNDLYNAMVLDTHNQAQLESLKESLLGLAADTMTEPETDDDYETQHEIAIAFVDRIRAYLVNGEWPTTLEEAKSWA